MFTNNNSGKVSRITSFLSSSSSCSSCSFSFLSVRRYSNIFCINLYDERFDYLWGVSWFYTCMLHIHARAACCAWPLSDICLSVSRCSYDERNKGMVQGVFLCQHWRRLEFETLLTSVLIPTKPRRNSLQHGHQPLEA